MGKSLILLLTDFELAMRLVPKWIIVRSNWKYKRCTSVTSQRFDYEHHYDIMIISENDAVYREIVNYITSSFIFCDRGVKLFFWYEYKMNTK